jgi:tRNA pseudouridine55 synthase
MTEEPIELPVLNAESFVDGWREGVAVLVDKPARWSSFKVIRVLRSYTGIRKIGHAGTLDPIATGLLICCIGRQATRLISRFVGLDKEYEGCLRLGQTTASYDAETPVDSDVSVDHLSEPTVLEAMQRFVGTGLQTPPMYSAVKVEGKRLYKLARKGEDVERPARNVTIHQFDLVEKLGRDVTFRVLCSKGTYIRTLVHDLGRDLGVGAHLTALRRTAIGPYRVEIALDPKTLGRHTE